MAKAKQLSKLSDLIPDDRNANQHSEYGMHRLEKGLRQNGLGRSILISSDNKIIAGNGVSETAGSIGIENLRIIETDGKEVIAVKRTDIKSGTKEFYNMALSDNIIAKENIIMDADVVNAICEEYEIKEYEIEEWKMEDQAEKRYNKEGSIGKESEEKQYKESKYPLSIVLTRDNMRKWDAIKKDFKVSEDDTAFLKLLSKHEIK